MYAKIIMLMLTASVLPMTAASAGTITDMLKGAGRIVINKMGGEAIEAGAKSTAKQTARKVASEIAEANTKQLGARAAVGLSDDVARASLKSAAPQALVPDAASVIGKLSAQSARRLEMMQDSIQASGRGPEIMAAIAKDGAGDQLVDFLWRNKATLVGGAAVTTVLMNPEAAFGAAGEFVAGPAIEGSMQHVVAPLIGDSIFNFWLFIVMGAASVLLIFGFWRASRKWRLALNIAPILWSRRR